MFQTTLLLLAKVLFNSANTQQLILGGTQLYVRYFPLSDKCFVDSASLSVWHSDVLHCLPGFSDSGFEKGEEAFQLLATVTSFQLENKTAIHMRWKNGYIWYFENINLIHLSVCLSLNLIFHIAFAHFTFRVCTCLVLSSLWLSIYYYFGILFRFLIEVWCLAQGDIVCKQCMI